MTSLLVNLIERRGVITNERSTTTTITTLTSNRKLSYYKEIGQLSLPPVLHERVQDIIVYKQRRKYDEMLKTDQLDMLPIAYTGESEIQQSLRSTFSYKFHFVC